VLCVQARTQGCTLPPQIEIKGNADFIRTMISAVMRFTFQLKSATETDQQLVNWNYEKYYKIMLKVVDKFQKTKY
jgi:hypothetical protein